MAERGETCAFFVKKKRRRCRLQPVRDSIYCGEHLSTSESLLTKDGGRKHRIPCPLNPKHTVFQHLLHRHLKKCNVARRPHLFCYTPNINSGMVGYDTSPEEKLSLSSFPQDKIDDLIVRVERAYAENVGELGVSVLEHPAMAGELRNAKNGPSALKHLRQQASILGHMAKLDLLSPRTCFIEFGAGRGKLSHWVQEAIGAAGAHYVLVDRANCRRKMDSAHKTAGKGATYERLLMDIEHLNLGKLESLYSVHAEQTVGISKHLCGAATDLTLRCLVGTLPPPSLPVSVGSLQSSEHDHTVGREPTAQSSICLHPDPLLQDQWNPQEKEGPEEEDADMCAMEKDVELRVKPPPERQPSPKLAGVVIALCCHHRCNWPHLVGKEFFTSFGFSPADFHLISLMSSWAVCGVRPQKTAVCESTTTEDDVSPPNTSVEGCCCTPSSDCDRSVHSVGAASTSAVKDTEEAEHTPHSGYVPHPREPIGLKCKRLIDFARAWYLRQHGFKARLVYFVEQTTSLENVLLIAVPP